MNISLFIAAIFNFLSLFQDGNYYQPMKYSVQDTINTSPVLFQRQIGNFRSSQFSQSLKQGTILKMDTAAFNKIKAIHSFDLNLVIPYQNENLELEMHQVDLFTDDFKVRTSDQKEPIPFTPGLYYSGHVKGDPKSIVSFSIFDGEVNGIFSVVGIGDLALVKTKQSEDQYLVFNESDLLQDRPKFECLTKDDDQMLNKMRSKVNQNLEQRAAGCIAIDFEFDSEIYTDFGSNTTTVTNWFTSLFNHIKAIYVNEQIEINAKSFYFWTTADPYSSAAGTALDQVMAARQNDGNFTGNLHHLVLGYTNSSISGIAYLDVLCDRGFRFGTTILYQYTTWSTFPSTYQWDIGSIAHELGHNFGSNHTQWCGWTGGAIDNCASTEGGCTGPTSFTPTIMSYCHNVPAYRNYPMSNGFGPQPGAAIRANYNAATCKSMSCTGIVVPTCTDGVQNGTETGIDCGGSSCAACNTDCPGTYNISLGKVASQSSNFDSGNSYPASNSSDGNSNNFNHTSNELRPWWQIDLATLQTVSSIEITHRSGCTACAGRIKNFKVFLTSSPLSGTTIPTSGQIYTYSNSTGLGNGQVLNITGLASQGRYLRIWVDNGSTANPIHLAEVKVFGCTSNANACANNQTPSVSISSTSTSYPQGGSFTINASPSDGDGNNTISQVDFFNGSTLLGTDNSSPYSFTVSPASAANYTITAKATDICNAQSSASSVLNMTSTVSCSDGIQNGDETGIDCGGSNCQTCPQGCTTSVNISQGKTASQSSNFDAGNSYPASRAVDGSTSNFNHTTNENQPWWQVDLGSTHVITSISITHRTDCPSCGGRIKKFKVFVSNTVTSSYASGGNVYLYDNASGMANGQVINITGLNSAGRYVRIWVDHGSSSLPLHFAEVRVMGCTSSVNPCLNNQTPSITANTNASTYIQGSSFTINASPSDPDGSIDHVDFFDGSTLLGSDNATPFNYTVNPANNGSYSITTKAIDNCGATSAASSPISITTTQSCTDGFKNGAETGVDCGGSCTVCQGCTTTTNISQGKTASQSTNFDGVNSYPASRAVDGSSNSSTNFNHTTNETKPWWQVDLGAVYNVNRIEITHRVGCASCAGRIKNFKIFVSNTPITNFSTAGHIYQYTSTSGMQNGQILNLTGLAGTGRYVKIWVDHGTSLLPLHFAEVKVFGCSPTGASIASNAQEITSRLETKISIFPNPTSNILNVEFFRTESLEPIRYSIVDVYGRILRQDQMSTYKIDVSDLAAGSYILNLFADGEKAMKKFVKF